jgi:hypothetical protein
MIEEEQRRVRIRITRRVNCAMRDWKSREKVQGANKGSPGTRSPRAGPSAEVWRPRRHILKMLVACDLCMYFGTQH